MRKITIAVTVFAAALLTACVGNQNENQGNGVENDSVNVEAAEELADAEEATQPAEFMSDDLKKFGLLGQVKEVSSSIAGGGSSNLLGLTINELAFNNDGKLQTNMSDYEFTTNDEGFATKYLFYASTDGTSETTLGINHKGWPEEATGKVSYAWIEGTVTVKYTYTEFDSHGNWTSRKAEETSIISYMDEETGDYGEKQTEKETYTETRTITYYE